MENPARSTLAGLTGAGGEDTAREIAQQPEVWRQIGGATRAASTEFLRPLLDRPEVRLVITGAGSSAFAGQVLAPHLAARLRRRVDAVATTDIVASPEQALAEDVPTLLVSLARSGDSPESAAATELADRRLAECHHLIVTCNPEGHLAREHADRPRSHVIQLPPAANDRGFAMTSSFTGMVLAALLALDGATEALVEPIATAAQQLMTTRIADARALADRGPERLVYLGSGALRGLASEAALKALELTAGDVVALADSALGFRHGPKSVLNQRTQVVVLLSNHPYTRRYDLDILAELGRAVDSERLIAVSADGHPEPKAGRVWALPGLAPVPDAVLALPAVIAAQMLALALSLARGHTPDNPFPSGEVNRVVQGVTIHPPAA